MVSVADHLAGPTQKELFLAWSEYKSRHISMWIGSYCSPDATVATVQLLLWFGKWRLVSKCFASCLFFGEQGTSRNALWINPTCFWSQVRRRLRCRAHFSIVALFQYDVRNITNFTEKKSLHLSYDFSKYRHRTNNITLNVSGTAHEMLVG